MGAMKTIWIVTLSLLFATPAMAQTRVLDAFEDLTPWTADASTDVDAAVSVVEGHDGEAMRLTYDFNGRSGYAFAARALPLSVPENYEIAFWVRGQGPTNTLEIKLVDASGENVHWRRTPNWTAPNGWTLFTIKKRQIDFAWGPTTDKTFTGAARIEFVVTAGEGGRGFIEVDQLTLRELPPEPSVDPRPVATASSAAGADVAARAVDDDPATAWRTTGLGEQSLTLDLGYERAFGGLTLRWANKAAATAYRIDASPDGQAWRPIASVGGGDGGVDWVRTPETSARYLRLSLGQALGDGQTAYALNALEIEPLAFGETPTTFIQAIAGESRRGLYPRGFHGEQPYWTLVGVDGGGESGLIGEDGAIELRRSGPSIEPFVLQDGRLVTWADVNISQSQRDRDLPIPSVTWTADDWRLTTAAFAEGTPDQAQLWGRYVLTNTSPRPLTLTLALAARPYQVNGPRQFLAIPGGVGPIRQVDWNGSALVLNDALRVSALARPDGVVAAAFDAGSDPQSLLATGRRSSAAERLAASDTTELMSAALLYDVTLQPGETRTFGWMAPLSGAAPRRQPVGSAATLLEAAETRVAASWREKLDRVDLILPPEAQRIEDTVRSSLAHMLMSRQGPSLQPGTRSYNRSWIRDGAMMAEGLNRLGHADLSAEYLRWYAPHVFDNGKVPCCVDARGADPVPENDSHGEFIFLAAETWRYTRDDALLRRVWEPVKKAAAYMNTLRAETRTEAYEAPDKAHLFGLLPPSISHEGYSDRPAYSYWDDFWGLLGYRDAAFIAEVLGDEAAAGQIRVSAGQFRSNLMASIRNTATHHQIDWIAGAADRGDFDATSTTIGLSPGGLIDELPQDLLRRTFDKYWENFQARRSNREDWDVYTPYELRVVGAFVRLRQRDRALEALDWFFHDVRPQAWNGWAEVAGRDKRRPIFIGDMPHAWISSDYIRSALDLLAYERESDHALMLAAGVPLAWIDSETGVGVERLRTSYGALSYRLKKEGRGYVLTVSPGATPPGGFVLRWPEGSTPPARVTIDGRDAAWTDGELSIPVGARRVEMR